MCVCVHACDCMLCVAVTRSNCLNVWPLTGVSQDLCFQTPAVFTVNILFLSRHCEGWAKRGREKKVWRDEWGASLLVALINGGWLLLLVERNNRLPSLQTARVLTRVPARRPSISPLLPPLSSSEGNASELLEITLMERAKWQSAHSSTLI